MEYLLIWLGCGVVSAMIASSKGNSGCGWFAMGGIVGANWIIDGVFTSDNEQEKNIRKGNNKKCPYCAEYVKQEAVVCKHCGRSLGSGDSDFDIERYRGN